MKVQALHAHICELEELVEDLLADARTGDAAARARAVSLQKDVMAKRYRLQKLRGDL